MFLRILFLTAITLQISGCIATPHFGNRISEDYVPPEEKRAAAQAQAASQEKKKPELSELAKEEIRKQVREEIRLQNAAQPITTTTIPPATAPKNSVPRQAHPPVKRTIVNPDSNI